MLGARFLTHKLHGLLGAGPTREHSEETRHLLFSPTQQRQAEVGATGQQGTVGTGGP